MKIIRKQQLLILIVSILLVFIITTSYLLITITSSNSNSLLLQRKDQAIDRKIDIRGSAVIVDRIYMELDNLPERYKTVQKQSQHDYDIDNFIKSLKSGVEIVGNRLHDLWTQTNTGVSRKKRRIIDLQQHNLLLGNVFLALKQASITKADLDARGTQLKLLLTLEGGQNVVFKPKWYDKDRIINGPVYAGKDRYGSEIVAFYLSGILGKPLAPISVERTISLRHDILPVATQSLRNTTTITKNHGQICVYGRCFYCKKSDPVCSDARAMLTGAIIFNINGTFTSHRSPWQRTYKETEGRRALWQDADDNGTGSRYCREKFKSKKQLLFNLIDTSVFDFLIQNGDRHHYETFRDDNNTVLWLDNGKGFGNPYVQHVDILAPLYQCCVLRYATWTRLLSLSGGKLRMKLEQMPDIRNLISDAHLRAIEQRLLIVFATVEYCRSNNRRTIY